MARRPSDAVAGVLLWGIAALIWQQSTTWPDAADIAGDPVVMPRALAGVMALAGIALMVRTRPAPEAPEGGRLRPMDTLLAAGATIGLALLLEPLGLIVAGAAYILVLQRIVAAPWRLALPFAVATPVAVWLVFVTALHVPLPSGSVWPALFP